MLFRSEDYVAMGYNSALKSIEVAEKLEYILAIELLSSYQSYQYIDENLKRSTVTERVCEEIESCVPVLEEDEYLYPYIVHIRNLIHSGKILSIVEEEVGEIY